MGNLYKLYIADDEEAIRNGIKCIIDWEALGYTICGEAENGTDAVKDILSLSPELTLLDIRMPKLSGLEVIKEVTKAGYSGHFIILSGYSDFSYAKEAMKYGVKHYLTKPIDEDELADAVKEISASCMKALAENTLDSFLRKKSRNEILSDVALNKIDFSIISPSDIGFDDNIYQIVIYESFDLETTDIPYQFSDLFRMATNSATLFEHFVLNGLNLLLLCGTTAIERFKRFLSHYDRIPEAGSPLDSLFIAYGEIVHNVADIHESYEQAITLLSRRFFCVHGQHVLGYKDFASIQNDLKSADKAQVSSFSSMFIDQLQTFNRHKVAETLTDLEEYLRNVNSNLSSVKLFLTDLFLQVKSSLFHTYPNADLPFETNSQIIDQISKKHFLCEVTAYFSEQFGKIMNALGGFSRESVMNDILYYIDHNYNQNIKIEQLAELFGYNPSYLGKALNRTLGESFNSYIDRIRISHAIELLKDGNYKVYEISEKVGYNNVDYFHKKFKKYSGMSPAEFRKKQM